MNTTIFYSALFVHLVSLIIGFGSVIVMDTIGTFWIFKKVPSTFLHQASRILGKLVWTGWTGLVLSGIILITKKGYIDNLTWVKLFFVAMLGVNGYFLHRMGKVLEAHGDLPLAPYMRFKMVLTGAVSQIGWWGAIAIGFVHRHIAHTISWPEHPFYIILIFATVLLFVVSLGWLLLKEKR